MTKKTCFAAIGGSSVIGCGVLDYTFYHHGWIEMLYPHPKHWRVGAGKRPLNHPESICRTPRFFTSTNLSNLPMQSLPAKTGYVLSGVIHNLDENDPEIIYFKRLERDFS